MCGVYPGTGLCSRCFPHKISLQGPYEATERCHQYPHFISEGTRAESSSPWVTQPGLTPEPMLLTTAPYCSLVWLW